MSRYKEPSNFQLLFVTEITQLNATHAQLLEKIETDCFSRNVLISNDPVDRILRNLAKKLIREHMIDLSRKI